MKQQKQQTNNVVTSRIRVMLSIFTVNVAEKSTSLHIDSL